MIRLKSNVVTLFIILMMSFSIPLQTSHLYGDGNATTELEQPNADSENVAEEFADADLGTAKKYALAVIRFTALSLFISVGTYAEQQGISVGSCLLYTSPSPRDS